MSLPARVSNTPEIAYGTERLRLAIAGLDDQRAALAEAGDWETLLRGYTELLPLLRDLREFMRTLEDDTARLLPEKQVEVDGLGVVERRKGTDRKRWDSDGLLREVVTAASEIDQETGEKQIDPERLLSVLKAAVPFTGSLGWRVKALRDLGLDPDEWCESSPGRVSLQIHGGEK